MKHSELPWIVGWNNGLTGPRVAPFVFLDGVDCRRVPISKGNQAIAWVVGYEGDKHLDADAQFIVKACNNHYKLLEALKELMSSSGGGKKACGHDFTCSCAWDKAKQAIKEAE